MQPKQTIEGVPGPIRQEIERQKEIGVAEHIRNAAPDGCVCEPCEATRIAPDAMAFAEAAKDLAPKQVVPVLAQGSGPSIQEELDAIKDQVNEALSTMIEMIVGLEERFDTLDQRIAEFNRKGGHKL